MNHTLSIIIPCYNEEANLRRGVLDEVADFLTTLTIDYEVLICNDQSTDNSLAFAQDFASKHSAFRVLDLPHGGKASALFSGVKQAKKSLVLFTDMDQSTPLRELNKLLPFFDQNYDIVIGSRGASREGNSFIRKLGSRVFAGVRNVFLSSHIVDTQCGFKAMKTEIAKLIFPRLAAVQTDAKNTGWRVTAYDVEMLFIAQKLGYKIKEVQVDWRNEDVSTTKGDANTRYFKESKQMAQEVWRIFINNLKHLYDPKRLV